MKSICPKCRVPFTSDFCVRCGTSKTATEEAQRKTGARGCIGCLAVFLLFGIAGAIQDFTQKNSPQQTANLTPSPPHSVNHPRPAAVDRPVWPGPRFHPRYHVVTRDRPDLPGSPRLVVRASVPAGLSRSELRDNVADILRTEHAATLSRGVHLGTVTAFVYKDGTGTSGVYTAALGQYGPPDNLASGDPAIPTKDWTTHFEFEQKYFQVASAPGSDRHVVAPSRAPATPPQIATTPQRKSAEELGYTDENVKKLAAQMAGVEGGRAFVDELAKKGDLDNMTPDQVRATAATYFALHSEDMRDKFGIFEESYENGFMDGISGRLNNLGKE